MSDKPKVVSLEQQPDKLAAAIEQLRRGVPNMIEHAALVAKIKRAYYDNLISEGFTNEQALELCKHSMQL